MDDRSQKSRMWAGYATLGLLGWMMVLPIVIGVLIDYYGGTRPWLTLAGIVVGFAGGLTQMIRIARRESRESNAEDQRRKKQL